jgi:hypothetical protein
MPSCVPPPHCVPLVSIIRAYFNAGFLYPHDTGGRRLTRTLARVLRDVGKAPRGERLDCARGSSEEDEEDKGSLVASGARFHVFRHFEMLFVE